MASLASYPQKSVFKPATLQVVLEFPLPVVRQYPAFLDKLPSEIRRDSVMLTDGFGEFSKNILHAFMRQGFVFLNERG